MKTYDQETGDDDEEGMKVEEPKYTKFQGDGVTLGNDAKGINTKIDGEDPGLFDAIKMSFGDMFEKMPEKTDKTIDLKVRFPDGTN